MSRQSDIREGIADIVWKQVMTLLCGDSEALEEVDTRKFGYGKRAAEKILDYLHSQGVVIKVDENKLPTISYHSAYPENEELYQTAMLKAGYVAVESLIDKG